jgi:hypothetical protein
VIVEATVARIDAEVVEEDGFPLTMLRLEVHTVLRGNVPSGHLTFGLPGGYVDGVFYGIPGVGDVIREGDRLIVVGDAVNETDIQMLSGPKSIYRNTLSVVGDIATDYDGNPIVEVGCTGADLIARPSEQAPATDEGGRPQTDLLGVVPLNRLFVDQPELLGLPWPDFVDRVRACVDAQTASADSQTELGGGW